MKRITLTKPYRQAVAGLRGTRLKHATDRVERLVERVGLSVYVVSETLEIPSDLAAGPFELPARRLRLAPDREIVIDPSQTVVDLLNDAALAAALLGKDGEAAERSVRAMVERRVFERVATAVPCALNAGALHERILMIQPYGDFVRLAGLPQAFGRGLTAPEKADIFSAADQTSAPMARDMPLFKAIVRATIDDPDRGLPDGATAAYLWMTSRTIMTGPRLDMEREAVEEGSEYGALRLRGALASLSRQMASAKQKASLTDHDALAARVVREFVL